MERVLMVTLSAVAAQGGAFEWEFGFALFENFVPPIPPMDVGFLKTKRQKAKS